MPCGGGCQRPWWSSCRQVVLGGLGVIEHSQVGRWVCPHAAAYDG